jgi:hypothetical protein
MKIKNKYSLENTSRTIANQPNPQRKYFRKRLRRNTKVINYQNLQIKKVNESPVANNKKIPIQQNSAENFCKTNCVQGNQPKKCYINGNLGQCSSCKFGKTLTGPKEQKIQKICYQLCNFIPSQGICKSFAYVLKLKVDSHLL